MAIAEFAILTVLLLCAGLLIRSFLTLDNVPAGFDARPNLLYVKPQCGQESASAEIFGV